MGRLLTIQSIRHKTITDSFCADWIGTTKDGTTFTQKSGLAGIISANKAISEGKYRTEELAKNPEVVTQVYKEPEHRKVVFTEKGSRQTENASFCGCHRPGMVQETEKYCDKGTTTKFPIETNKCIGELLFHHAEPLVWGEVQREVRR